MLDCIKNTIGALIGWGEKHNLISYPVTHYISQVSPDLWRGSRLREEDCPKILSLGIRTAVNFCLEDNKDSQVCPVGVSSVRIPVLDNTPPKLVQVSQFLAIFSDLKNVPVFCHCEAGRGRTGVFVACYRIGIQKWSNEAALKEAVEMGLAMPDQKQFILDFKFNSIRLVHQSCKTYSLFIGSKIITLMGIYQVRRWILLQLGQKRLYSSIYSSVGSDSGSSLHSSHIEHPLSTLP